MTYENRLKHLEEAHTMLNKQIDVMEKTGVYGDNNIHDLKKKRLQLKDQIKELKEKHGE